MRTMKLVFAVSSLSLAACGDDGVVPADARVDGPAIDAPADGRVFAEFEANEGGEVRAEYITAPNGNTFTRTTAFFYKDSGPTKFFEYIDQNGCTDVTALAPGKMMWPMATNPIGERVYYDVGPYVVISGGPNPLPVKKNAAMMNDPFARMHPANGWYFDPGTGADNDAVLYETEKTLYDVTLPGSSEFPGQHFVDAIYIPANFQMTTCSPGACPSGVVPGLSGAPIVYPTGTAQTYSWTVPAEAQPAGTEVLSLVGFTGTNGPVVLCVEPNDGSMTIPAAMMDVALNAYPTGGTLVRQTLHHQVRELVDANGPTGKRIDFLGVWCYAGQPYSKAPPP